MNYVPLHVHSDASSDGAGTVESLVKEAKRIGFESLACTDHGTLANAVAFWSECTDYDIKPIMGIEAYILYKGARHHITLLSQNEEGFNNLIYMNSNAHTNRFVSGYPLITLDDFSTWGKGIFALTGCASSALHAGLDENGLNYVYDLVDVLGRDRVWIETMFVGTHDIWTRPIKLAHHTGLPIVVTNDTHYPCQGQFPAHQAITQARKGFTYDSRHLWLKSAKELALEGSKFVGSSIVETGMHNTLAISAVCESWDMRSAPTLPHIGGVGEKLSAMLKEKLKLDVTAKGGKDKRIQRLKYEYHILKEKGFLDYIYILLDIVSWAKSRGILVGPGRGSGGGSYILYLLGITQVDPLEYGLLFERFINPSRADYPDVDVDFESDRRSEVMQYAHERWGTMPIATYSSYSHKSAIHDIARTLTIPKTIELEAADSARDSDKFERFIASHPDALLTYNTMLGQIRHRGKHAAGVVIANRPVPIERAGDELVVAWAEGMNTKDLSKVGIVKFDLLGLSALTQLKMMREMSRSPIPTTFDDENVFMLFQQGDVAGIFQWTGSDGIRDLTMRISPTNFKDLATINALYRPGALDAGTAEMYPDFMEEPRLLHPRIDPLLANTYGVICYQEQVMAVVAEVMGGDLAQADIARRLMSKADVGNSKWEAEIDSLQRNFFIEGEGEGFKKDLLEVLWFEIMKHSSYSFNLSHATTYTMISYQMAWYKTYHREVFTVAMLQHDRANAQDYIMDAVDHSLHIHMPHVNYSGDNYVLKGKSIFIPLSDVAYLGEEAVKTILLERGNGGEFFTYEDFDKRIPKKKCNARARAMLERIGAFSELEGDPKSAIASYEDIPVKDKYQTQLEVLGYVVPTPKLLVNIAKLEGKPVRKGYERFAGFVKEVKEKKSAKGPYSVYYLSPYGSFWIRGGDTRIQVGSFVSGTKSDYGNSSDAKVYRIVSSDDE